MNNLQTRFGIVLLVLIAVIGFMLGRSTKIVVAERAYPKNIMAEAK